MKENKGKKTGKIIGIIIGIAAAALAAAGIAYCLRLRGSDVFFRNTSMEGTDLSGLTPAEASEKLLSGYKNVKISLTEDGKTVLTGTPDQYGYSFDQDQLEQTLTKKLSVWKENPSVMLRSLAAGNTLHAEIPMKVDEDTFNAFVKTDNLSVKRTNSQDASIAYDKNSGKVVVKEAVKGNEIDDAAFQKSTKSLLNQALENWDGKQEISLEIPKEAYVNRQVQEATDAMRQQAEALSGYAGTKVTYTFGNQTEVLDSSTIMSWFDVSGDQVTLNDEKVRDYVSSLAKKYRTRSVARKFKTSGGKVITIPAGLNSYGYIVNQDAEAAQLKKDIESRKEVTREPVYYKENSYHNPYYLGRNGTDDLNGTYIEVDQTKQHMWFYKNGRLVVESDVVTGDVTKGRGTITGAWPIAYKKSPAVLSGATGEYHSNVTYWMPFYDGEGFHDATWRSSFGGSIYRGNGSHGCVNMPKSAAAVLYKNLDVGTAVILYK